VKYKLPEISVITEKVNSDVGRTESTDGRVDGVGFAITTRRHPGISARLRVSAYEVRAECERQRSGPGS
jgi:hypothetical protein